MTPVRLLMRLTLCLLAGISFVLASPALASFPGKNGKIVFSKRIASGEKQLFTMNPDGSSQTALPAIGSGPSWSPDGTRIAFIGRDAIWTMNADGSAQTKLVTLGTSGCCTPPAWSPDGNRIAFQSNGDIWTIGADRSNLVQLTSGASNDAEPAWSPDGRKIAFSSDRDPPAPPRCPLCDTDIYVLEVASGVITRLTTAPGLDLGPSWSPDGTQIAFSSDRHDVSQQTTELYKMNGDASGQTRLTNDNGTDAGPFWSPDGTKIAFTSNRDGLYQRNVYAINPDGSGEANLTNSPPASRENPNGITGGDWQPIPAPKRSDYKNAAKFCKAEHAFWGDTAFEQRYGGRQAFSACVRQH